jgi:hypothetical protein
METLMNKIFTLKNSIVVIALVGASAAQAAANNPLQPSYFWDKVQAAELANTSDTAGYRATNNPLDPSYYAGRTVAAYVGTGDERPAPVTNPLHPQFAR